MTSGAKLFYGIALFFGVIDLLYILATIFLKDAAME